MSKISHTITKPKIRLIYKDSNFEIWGSDSILAINNTKKEYGRYTIDLEQVEAWTHEIVDSIAKNHFNELSKLIKSFLNN